MSGNQADVVTRVGASLQTSRTLLITVVASNAPWQICCLAVDDDGAAGGEHGAGPGDGLVGAAEPLRCMGGGGGLQQFYAPLFWRLKADHCLPFRGKQLSLASPTPDGCSPAARASHRGLPRVELSASTLPSITTWPEQILATTRLERLSGGSSPAR